jgi:hypothetical protein
LGVLGFLINPSLTQRPEQKNKKQKPPQVAMEEHDIVDISSKGTPWPKKTIRSKVKKTRSRSTN